jgi:nitrate reductase gamma subunit
LEGVGGAVGFAAVISSAALIAGQLRKPTASLVNELFETVFMAFLLVGAVSGILVAILHRWGSSWGVTILTPYVLSILRAQPAAYLAVQMPFLVRLHIVSAFAALALVPFTRLSTFFVVALHRCVFAAAIPVRATVSAVNSWITKHNPNAWFWPEED